MHDLFVSAAVLWAVLAGYYLGRARRDRQPTVPPPTVEYWELGDRVLRVTSEPCPCGKCSGQVYGFTVERGAPMQIGYDLDEVFAEVMERIVERKGGK